MKRIALFIGISLLTVSLSYAASPFKTTVTLNGHTVATSDTATLKTAGEFSKVVPGHGYDRAIFEVSVSGITTAVTPKFQARIMPLGWYDIGDSLQITANGVYQKEYPYPSGADSLRIVVHSVGGAAGVLMNTLIRCIRTPFN